MIILILLVAFYISNNWVQLMMIQGESMSPTYRPYQIVLMDRYHEDYSYADVVAFYCEALSEVLVKRIAACPGDLVVIENGTLYVNGQISTVYPEKGHFLYAGLLEKPIKLEAGQYIVIGDNTAKSKDSRYPEVGWVNVKDFLGEVMP